ncbi:MAG: spore coat U domain-containing protein [Burkholderiaceae bacterium]
MKTKRFLLLKLLCLPLALLLAAGSARALCVLCVCTTTTSNVAFGSYNPLAFGNLDSTGSVLISCGGVASVLLPYNLAISTGGSGSYAARRMSSGGYTLNYNLYADPAYTTIFGDGSGSSVIKSGSFTLDLLGLSPNQLHTVYGRVPGRQLTVAPGVYTDSINVTLTYF